MEPLFKVGDIVRVRDLDKIEKETQSGLPFGRASKMDAMAGWLCTITGVEPHRYDARGYPRLECDECLYKISPDLGHWSWSSPMLEKVYKECDAQDTRTKDETSFIDEVQKSLDCITSACGVPQSLLQKMDAKVPEKIWDEYFADKVVYATQAPLLSITDKKCDPLKLAIKKHSVKLNFKN